MAVLRVAPKRYYETGGCRVHDGQVSVGDVWTTKVRRVQASDVAAVVCVRLFLGRGDWRVLLVNSQDRVLVRTTGIFYSDDALAKLAASLGCEYRREDFRSIRKLDKKYPGALGTWERHPYLIGLLGGVVLVGLMLLISWPLGWL